MIIPIEQLSTDILDNIIKEFILREGTDYGAEEVNFEDKAAEIKQQLINGEIVVVYSELHETVNIMPANQFS